MGLTGKAEKDFTQYIKNDESIGELETERVLHYLKLGKLRAIWGYLLDWFDSVGVNIQMYTDYGFEGYNLFIYDGKKEHSFDSFSGDKLEARTEAIKEANGIYNNK